MDLNFNRAYIRYKDTHCLKIIPRARIGSDSIAHEVFGSWANDSEAMRAREIIVFIRIQRVGKKYRDKATLASYILKIELKPLFWFSKPALFATSGL